MSNERKPPIKTLEEKIIAALSDGKNASHDLEALIGEVHAGIEAAEQVAKEQRQRSLDMLATTDVKEAHEAVGVAVLRRDRLATILPRLEDKLADALAEEFAVRWLTDYQKIEAQRDAAAERFKQIPKLVAEMVAIFSEAETVDKETSRINGSAPSGERRRLRGVELTARPDLQQFTRDQPALTKSVRLFDLATGKQIWPIPEAPMSAAFAQSMVAEGHSGSEWWRDSERRAAEHRDNNARMATYYADQTKEQEARTNREERERHATRHGA